MGAYYNEINPYAAQWLRNLIKAGHIADGEVDERSIKEVSGRDLDGFTQCHFFAGIGVWSHALRSAGWPDDRQVWTGSCPCQPFSAAGKRRGFDDDRHLWPAWFQLIKERHPSVVFGEQVASPDGLGWLDLVSSDMEGANYAFGAADLCAAGIGAPHIRQRLFFAGDADCERLDRQHALLRAKESGRQSRHISEASGRSTLSELADTERSGGGERGPSEESQRAPLEPDRYGATGELADSGHARQRGSKDAGESDRDAGLGAEALDRRPARILEPERGGTFGELGDYGSERLQIGPQPDDGSRVVRIHGPAAAAAGVVRGFWGDADLIWCQDGRYRAVEPGTFPLAHGVAGRVGKLRAYGNAIVAPVAETFIRCFLEL